MKKLEQHIVDTEAITYLELEGKLQMPLFNADGCPELQVPRADLDGRPCSLLQTCLARWTCISDWTRHGTALGFVRFSWHDAKFSAWEHGDHDDVSRKWLTQSPCCLLWSQHRFAAAGDQRAWSVSGATRHHISPPWRHFASHRRSATRNTPSSRHRAQNHESTWQGHFQEWTPPPTEAGRAL